MDDLVRWLTVQLDEDERITRAVEDRSAPWDGQWMADGNSAVRTFNRHVLFYRHGPDPLKPGLADHVAEWDPARVLREIEATRRLLRAHAKWCSGECEAKYPDGGFDAAHYWNIKLRAEVYDHRPGYREEWRP